MMKTDLYLDEFDFEDFDGPGMNRIKRENKKTSKLEKANNAKHKIDKGVSPIANKSKRIVIKGL